MYIHGVQCDDCKKIHQAVNIGVDELPNWIVLKQREKSNLYFCSIHCLGQWVRKEEDKTRR